MTEHVTGLTLRVNQYLGHFALALLSWLHVTPENPETPIPQHVVMGAVVLILGTLLALFLRSRLSVEKPGPTQQVAELLLTNPLGFGIKDLLEENVHHGALKLIPFVGSISVFVLLSNLLSVFPPFAAPTSNKSVPLACAILTFLYFISLTVRLWANIVASDLLYSIFLSLFSMATVAAWSKSPIFGIVIAVLPATIPIAFIGLHIFVAIIQSYIFTVLPSVYLGMATADEH